MNPWITMILFTAPVVFLIDYILRRKKWKDNTKLEKISLVIHMISIIPYLFLSVLGMLWGIAGNSPETDFGNMIYDATLTLAGLYFVVAIIAAIATFVLRKIGKTKASIWINIIAFAYIAIILFVNYLAGGLL